MDTHNRVNIWELLFRTRVELGKLSFGSVEPVCKLPSRSSIRLCMDACLSERVLRQPACGLMDARRLVAGREAVIKPWMHRHMSCTGAS
jgi:hypothetical protein